MTRGRAFPCSGHDLQLYFGQAGLVPVFQQQLAAMRREGAHELMLDRRRAPVEPCLRHVALHSVERAFIVDGPHHDLELFMTLALASPEGDYEWTKLGLRGELSPEQRASDDAPDAVMLEITALGILRVRDELIRLSDFHLAPHSVRVLERLGRERYGEPLGPQVDALLQRWSGVELDLHELLGLPPARAKIHRHGGGKPGCLALMADLPERAELPKRPASLQLPDPPLLPPQHLVLWFERGPRPELRMSPEAFSRGLAISRDEIRQLSPLEFRERLIERQRYLFGRGGYERSVWKEVDESFLRVRVPGRIGVATSHTPQGRLSHGLVLKVLVQHSVREGVYLSIRLVPDDRPMG